MVHSTKLSTSIGIAQSPYTPNKFLMQIRTSDGLWYRWEITFGCDEMEEMENNNNNIRTRSDLACIELTDLKALSFYVSLKLLNHIRNTKPILDLDLFEYNGRHEARTAEAKRCLT